MSMVRVATTWFDGCSGCHMSFLDMDERLALIASRIDLVYSPIVDCKVFPDDVDVTLVEGAISNEHDRSLLEMIRLKTKHLISFGDCAITANVPSMRNRFDAKEVLEHAYVENATLKQGIPTKGTPALLTWLDPYMNMLRWTSFYQVVHPQPTSYSMRSPSFWRDGYRM